MFVEIQNGSYYCEQADIDIFSAPVVGVSDDANNVKIHSCWYAKNPNNGNYYFTYYISTMNENSYEYWGNDKSGFVNLTGESIDEAISTSSGWHRFWGQHHIFKINGKAALEMDYIELDADALHKNNIVILFLSLLIT